MSSDRRYPWSDANKAMEFAFKLSNARISEELLSHSTGRTIRDEGAAKRLTVLLNMLEEFAPIKFATLWKHKRRSGHISAVSRSASYRPEPFSDPQEFVCPIDGTHISMILQEAEEFPECSIPWIRRWSSEDLESLPLDSIWNKPELLQRGCDGQPLKRQLAITLGNFCSRKNEIGEDTDISDKDHHGTIDYILNMYFDESAVQSIEASTNGRFSFSNGPERDFIKSVANKIASGICALIELRKNQITAQMLSEHSSAQQGTMKKALTSATRLVLPDFIRCENVFLVSSTAGGHLVQFFEADGSFGRKHAMEHIDLIDLKSLLQNCCPKHPSEYTDASFLIQKAQITEHTSGKSWLSSCNQLLIGTLDTKTTPLGEKIHVVLVNRKSDLAAVQVTPSYEVDDFFDWEDQEYLEHIILILNYISDLFLSRERSIQRAGVLGHEIKAPIAFIYETAFRQLEIKERKREMPERMQLREINDILDTSEYIETLGASLSALLAPENLPPSSRYDPDEVQITSVARDMARICLPLCKKYRLDHSRIIVPRSYFTAYIDESALRQIFLNLLVNAVKYARVDKPPSFSVRVSFEEVSVDGLSITSNVKDNPTFWRQLNERGVSDGILVTVSDYGIGIAADDPQVIFEPGFREVTNIRAGIFGAGVGLSVVRNVLRDHGADIWVESRHNPTSISFFLPEFLQDDEYTKRPEWTSNRR